MSWLGDTISAVEKSGKIVEEVLRDAEQLTVPPPSVSDCFLCRDELVEELSREIADAKRRGTNKFLLSGLGGVGKTAVACALYHKLKKRCKKIGWVECRENGDLRESLLDALELYRQEENKEENKDERFRKIKKYLLDPQNEPGEIILFLDNVDWPDALLKSLTGYDITLIVTSRLEKVDRYITQTIGPLSEDECVEIFRTYYLARSRTVSEQEEKVVHELVRMVDCHTLSVELLAKGVPPKMTLTEYRDALKAKGFGCSDVTFCTDRDQEKCTVVKHLRKLFNLIGLGDEKKRVMKNLALMSNGDPLPAEVQDWIGCDENTLAELVNTGWLTQAEDNHNRVVYVIQPIIRKIILLDPVPEETIAHFSEYVNKGKYRETGTDENRGKMLRDMLDRVKGEVSLPQNPFLQSSSSVFEESATRSEAEDRFSETPKIDISVQRKKYPKKGLSGKDQEEIINKENDVEEEYPEPKSALREVPE